MLLRVEFYNHAMASVGTAVTGAGSSSLHEMSQPAQLKVVHATCSLDCPDSCGILATVDTATDRVIRIAGDPAHPVTRGFLCGKVARYLDRVYAPDRVLYPMRRRAGVPKGPLKHGEEAQAFERISWDEALDTIAQNLQKVSDTHGPESILPYSYAGTIGQLGYGSMDRRFFHRMGASQLDRTICATAGTAAFNAVYGTRLGPEPQSFVHAKLIIAWVQTCTAIPFTCGRLSSRPVAMVRGWSSSILTRPRQRGWPISTSPSAPERTRRWPWA